MSIEAVMQQHVDYLLGLPNVVGIAMGELKGQHVIKVLVHRKVPETDLEPREIVPKTMGGYRTDVEETGGITPA